MCHRIWKGNELEIEAHTKDDISAMIRQLKNKSSGMTGISAEMLKEGKKKKYRKTGGWQTYAPYIKKETKLFENYKRISLLEAVCYWQNDYEYENDLFVLFVDFKHVYDLY